MPRKKLSKYIRGFTNQIGVRTESNLLLGSNTALAAHSTKLQVSGHAHVSGNVGIGTSLPAGEMQIHNDGFSNIRITTARKGGTEQIGGVGFATFRSDEVQDQVATINALVDGTVLVKNGPSDTERLRIDPTGRLLVGLTSAMTTGSNDIRDTIQAVAPSGAQLLLGRNDTQTSGSNRLGEIAALGNDNNEVYQVGATIRFEAYSAHATDDKPTSIIFKTCGESSATLTERMRVGAGGTVYIGPNGSDFASGNNQRGQLHIEREVTYDADTPQYRTKNLLTLENTTDGQPCVQTFISNYSGSNRYANILWEPGSTNTNSYLKLNANINHRDHLVIKGDGQIGINSATPGSVLDVVGQTSEDAIVNIRSYNKKSAIKLWPSDNHDPDRWRMGFWENNAVSNGNDYPDWAVDGYGRQYQNNNFYIGRSRTFADAPVNQYRYYGASGPGIFIYNGVDGDSTNYSSYMTIRSYQTDTDDRNVIYWANAGTTTTLDYDAHQKFGVKGSGRVQGMYHFFAGRVESDEGTPNSIYQTSATGVYAYQASGEASARMIAYSSPTTSHNSFYQETGTSSANDDVQFRVRASDGKIFSDFGASVTAGADYAESFEWADGNPNNEDRVGYSVVIVPNTDGKIGIASTTDDTSLIIGVVSGCPAVLGDSADLKWQGRYLRDEYGREIMQDVEMLVWNRGQNEPQPSPTDTFRLSNCEESCRISEIDQRVAEGTLPQWAIDQNLRITAQERTPNPDYDPSQEYIPRSDRQEWDPIGLMGKLWLRPNQPTGDRWIKLRDGSNGLSYWLVR
jgi:hypothetical protein